MGRAPRPWVSKASSHRRRSAAAAQRGGDGGEPQLLGLMSEQLLQGLRSVAGAVATGGALLKEAQQTRPGMESFPPGPVGDVVLQLLADPVGCIGRLSRTYGGAVVIDDAANFVKEGTAFFPGSSLAGNGLLVSDGDMWRKQRQLSNPAFRQAAVRSYTAAMLGATTKMLQHKWRGKDTSPKMRSVYTEFNILTLEIIADAVFGTAIEETEAREVMDGIVTAFTYFGRRAATGFAIPEWLPTSENKEYQGAVKQLDGTVYRIIADRRAWLAEAAAQGEVEPQGLIDRLALSVDEAGVGMTDSELRDEIMTMMVAGQETSAILLTWVCALLAWHPDIQEKARWEVEGVLGGEAPQPASQLPFLEAILLETMRVLPPAYMIGRCAREDSALGEWRVPRGTTILVGCVLMHRDARYWDEDAGQFKPERWLDTSGSLAAGDWQKALSGMGANGAYLPFGGGPRNCIGTGFAMLETKLVMAQILQGFKLSPPPGAQEFPTPEAIITLRPPPELKLQIKPLR
eukprot:jgi/Tetstr1/442105/TSEL_030262.t1